MRVRIGVSRLVVPLSSAGGGSMPRSSTLATQVASNCSPSASHRTNRNEGSTSSGRSTDMDGGEPAVCHSSAVNSSGPEGLRSSHEVGIEFGSSSSSTRGCSPAAIVHCEKPIGSTGVVGSSSSGTGSHCASSRLISSAPSGLTPEGVWRSSILQGSPAKDSVRGDHGSR